MESLTSIIEVAKCFWKPIKHRVTLVSDHQAIKEDLRHQHAQLLSLQKEVQSDVTEAKHNGEKIIAEVDKWLEEVKTTEEEVKAWLIQTTTGDVANTGCGFSLNWCQRYKLSKEAMKKKSVVVLNIEHGRNISRVSVPPSPKGIQLVPRDDFTLFASVEFSFNEIVKALRKTRIKKVGVFGMGGIGKTTLVKEVGKFVKEKEGMFDQVVFAVVSQVPDIKKIQDLLGDELNLKFSKESPAGRAGQLKERLKVEKRVLVILDDVWGKIDLADIGIPFGADHPDCKILITTRRKPVCETMDCQEIIELNLLQESEALDLFTDNVGSALDESNPELEMVAKKVIRECNRLPLALVVVARALRGKSLVEWKTAAEQIEKSRLNDLETIDIEVYACLKLSYDYLKADDTKKCFLLCSLFPEDQDICIEELAKYALGYGMFQDIDSFQSVKSRVQSIIKDLKASSLLLNTDMVSHVKIHDMLRDAALWITSDGEEVFFAPIPSQRNWIRDFKTANATAISLLACPENQHLPNPKECSRLKMLLLAQRKPLPNVRNLCFDGMNSLLVLDMTAKVKNPLEMVLPSSLQLLSNLRVLYLRRWELKGDISIIGRLKSLENLSFAGSILDYLPKELLELSELRILDLSACTSLAGFDVLVLGVFAQKIEEYSSPKKKISDLGYDED